MKKILVLSAIVFVITACNSSSDPAGTYTVKSSASATATSIYANVIGDTTGSPTSLKQKFYAAWISPNEDCSSPVLLQDHGADGKIVEFYSGETIFSGSPADGTYKCLIIKMSDFQTFVPDAVAGARWPTVCTTGTTYDEDIFTEDFTHYLNMDGTFIDGQGTYTVPVEQTTYSFVTTNPSAVIALGASVYQVLELVSPLIVPGQGTLYTDFSDQVGVVENGTVCWLEEPVIGFR